MEHLKNSLKSISLNDSKLIIEKKYGGKTEVFELTSINNIYIKRKKIKSFYFFDSISFLLLFSSIIALNYVSNYLFVFLVVTWVFWTSHLLSSRSYYMYVKLNKVQSKNYFFSNEIKYDVLEKVKIVRGKLTSLNFKSILINES